MDAPVQRESSNSKPQTWTTRGLIRWIDGHLAGKGIDSPRVCAEMLVGHVLGVDRMRLYMEADRPAAPAELERLRALVARAAKHEPVQYLVGEAWFWSKQFLVGPATLIPRPATEHLVEECVRAARQAATDGISPVRILEIGTGTGCITTCVASALRGQRRGVDPGEVAPVAIEMLCVATDIVPGALELAHRNSAKHQVADAIDFRLGSLWAPLSDSERNTFHVIVSNPPYVRDDEWLEMAANVREHEPRTALAGGVTGMDVLAPLISNAHEWLAPGGRLVVEIGHRQYDHVLAAASANSALHGVEIRKDFEGFWRMLVATRLDPAS